MSSLSYSSNQVPFLSVVVPCYNEQETLAQFCSELEKAVLQIQQEQPFAAVEALFIDDGSTDGTLTLLQDLQQQNWPFEVRWLSFSRNFGKEAALLAGLEHACGNMVATMDADLQDPPSLLPTMVAELLANPEYDSIATRRTNRKGEPVVRSFFARRFYKLINSMSETEIVDGARDYRLMTRKMVNAVLELQERNRFSKGIFSWVGFKTKWIEYDNIERSAGKSSWSFSQLMRYSFDGIAGFSTVPLSIASYSGLVLCALAALFLIIVVVRALLFGDPVAGWPSTIAIILLLGGLQMLFLGVFGFYLAKTYTEVKWRPAYIVDKSSDDENAQSQPALVPKKDATQGQRFPREEGQHPQGI